jgi:glycosyltransferase involved in cell wall biosynthesis
MIISLILATLGRTDDVGETIRSLVAQTDRCFELIVVDQNPDDRLVPYVCEGLKEGLDIVHLRLDRPSLSGARNLGLARASGDIVAFPDDDCWYEPDTIRAALSAFSAAPTIDGLIGHWVEQAAAGNGAPPFETLSMDAWRRFRGGSASSITLFLKRNLFSRLGGFDERFGVGCWYGAGEETDFILRALTAHAKIVSSPDVRVHHRFSKQPTGRLFDNCRKARQRARGTGGLYAKHRLEIWVVLRGLLAPIFVPLLKADARRALYGLFISMGRMEGMIRWNLREGA